MILIFIILFWVVFGTITIYFNDIKNWFEKKPKYDYQTQLNFLNESLWVKQVINSCKTRKQVFNADKLIRCYREKYKSKVERTLYLKVCNDLEHYWCAKEDRLWDESKNK